MTPGDTFIGDQAFKTGDVYGTINYNVAPSASLLLPTPPAPPPHFTGREPELDRFAQRLTSGENVAITALQGMGGIGKTALAQKLAEQLQRKGDPRGRPYFPGGVLWWSLGPQPDVITALDVWARHADSRADLSSLPTAGARAGVVRSMLAKLGRLCAIIDDVWQADAARTLMSAVPPGCPILITTRDGDLAKELHCKVERIDALNEDEAIALLANLLGPLDGHASAARDIAALTEGLPLALELIAGLADSPADLPALAKRLRERPALGVLKLGEGETREESVEACLALSYTALDADMQRRFRALACFAPAPFDRAALKAVWGDEDEESVEQAIPRLTRRNLLSTVILSEAKNLNAETPHGPAAHALSGASRRGRAGGADATSEQPEYRQHALLRAYALALLERAGEYNDIAARQADYYRQFAKQKDWRAVENAFEQIDWGWKWVQTDAPTQIIDFVYAVRVFLNTRGRHSEHLNWLNVGLRQARAISDRKNEGTLLNNIGWVYDRLGQKEQALEVYQQALAIHREVGNRPMEGTTLNNIGLVHSALGQKDKALDFYQQALAIHREVGNRPGEGTTLTNLAAVYSALGQKDKALGFYQQALAITREVGDRYGEGMALWNLGDLLEKLDRLEEAERALQDAVTALKDASSPQAQQAQSWLDPVREKLVAQKR